MLDRNRTRENFLKWVKSPAFSAQCKARFKAPVWPFIATLIAIALARLFENTWMFEPSVMAAIGLPIWGWRRWKAARKNRDAFRKSLVRHEPMLCALIIGNRKLFRTKGAVAPALLLGAFGRQDEAGMNALLSVAEIFAGVYGESPDSVPAELKEICELMSDDTFRPDRRRQVPPGLFNNDNLWLFDTMLVGNDLPSGTIESPFVPCMVSPGPAGTIVQLPPSVAVFEETTYDPNIIHYSPRTEAAPIVAPHSDNLEAVTDHITRHLGNPATVFHELISTTVHIDVHIVLPTPECPWVSLVTSGMSDIPMNAPEGAEEFRFAELMIRLPADWSLGEEAFKDEKNYWPIRTLKFLARFVHEYETWLSFGHTIPNGNPPAPLAPGLSFIGVVLSMPWFGGEDLAVLRLPDGTPIRFWSVIPLHPSEMEFKLANGADALFERMAGAGQDDLFDPNRPPVA